jgi:transposase InsO family protein
MKKNASELFIVDNIDGDWKVRSYLSDWCDLSKAIDIATGYFEIGALLYLKEKWQSVDRIRILMGDEVSMRTKKAFAQGLQKVAENLDQSIEAEKLIDKWRMEYNTFRPHSSLNYRPPAPEVYLN